EAALILRWKQMRSSGIQYRQATEKKSYEIKISNKKSVSSGNAGLTLFCWNRKLHFHYIKNAPQGSHSSVWQLI
ncbi:MAG: hypothetical protein SOR88_11560, partial [Roseburia inulinivorans]|nr:hypothetical protein [Roseburia inulinivorans]